MLRKLVKLLRLLPHPLYIRALAKGAAAGVEHASVLTKLGEIAHVVDVGANRGQFALVCRKHFPCARIDSFEPLQEAADIFEKIFASDEQVKLHHYAIGPKTGDATMHVSKRDDSSSLLPIGDEQTHHFPATAEKEVRRVPVVTLDAVLGNGGIISPALLKIDVQGYELSVLQGCVPMLYAFQLVYVECSFVELYTGQALADEVIRFLADNGFHLTGVYNVYYDSAGRAIQADFLFSAVNRL